MAADGEVGLTEASPSSRTQPGDPRGPAARSLGPPYPRTLTPLSCSAPPSPGCSFGLQARGRALFLLPFPNLETLRSKSWTPPPQHRFCNGALGFLSYTRFLPSSPWPIRLAL